MTLFDFVKNQVPILDVISAHIKLRPMGTYFKGPCPFHSEKDASFTVSPDRQIFYCFGCQATGDVTAFVARLENFSQLEAVKMLIEQYGIIVPPDVEHGAFQEFKDFEKKDQHASVCHQVSLWAHKQLLKTPAALEYFLNRGINKEMIEQFLIGYFPSGPAHLSSFVKAMGTQGVLLKDLLEGGVIHQGKHHLYSPWEERLLFPIKNTTGQYCGFGGRVFRQHDDRAKYINSRESEWFAKGKLLFGFDAAKRAIQKKEAVFLVEGYMDCIAMVQYGHENTVATLGTACTLDHLKQLVRLAPTIYFLFDGDKAGQAALLRIAQLCWQANADLRVVVLPDGHDPASFLTTGKEIEPLVTEASDLFTFFVEKMSAGFLDKPLSLKIQLAKKVITVLVGIQDNFKQELLLHQAAQVMHVPFDTLKRLLIDLRKKTPHALDNRLSSQQQDAARVDKKEENVSEFTGISLLEEKIFSVILNGIASSDSIAIDDWVVPYLSIELQKLLGMLKTFVQNTDLPLSERYTGFLATLEKEDRDLVIRMSLRSDSVVSQGLMDDLITQFFKSQWKHMIRDMKDQMKKAEEKADNEMVKVLVGKIAELKQRMLKRGLI